MTRATRVSFRATPPGRRGLTCSRRIIPGPGRHRSHATCIHGCRWAWLAGSPDGIEVVDLRNPSHPRFAGTVRVGAAAGVLRHPRRAGRRSGLAWVAGSAGTAAYDVSDPAHPRLRFARAAAARSALERRHPPQLAARLGQHAARDRGGSEARLPRSWSFETWEIRAGARARPLDRFEVERDGRANIVCSSHYFDHRDGLVAAGFFQQGVRLLDVQDPRRITQVGYYISDAAMVWGRSMPDRPGRRGRLRAGSRQGDRRDRARARCPGAGTAPRPPGRSSAPLEVFGLVDDGVDAARPGQRLRIRFAAGVVAGPAARNVRLELQLPAYVRPLRLPRGARFDRRGQRVLLRLQRLRSPVVRVCPPASAAAPRPVRRWS